MKHKLSARAFTLMELLIVIAIIAILAVTFVPNALKAPARARDVGRINSLTQIRNTAELYFQTKGTMPTQANNNDSPCFTEDLKIALEMPQFFTDQTAEGSCSADAAKAKFFYYRASGNDFYIVAAKMENADSANTTKTLAEIDGVQDLAGAQALLEQKPFVNPGTFYVLVGPS